MKKRSVSYLYAVIDFAARLYLAYFLVDYGIAKLNGNMFNNITPEILGAELKSVDMFHLTWYWFKKNALLSYTIGVFQIVAAILLLFPRTVLLGCVFAFPVLFGILLVDIYCVPSPHLAVRVFFYNLLIASFCLYRKESIKNALIMLMNHISPSNIKTGNKVILIILMIPSIFIVEILFTQLGVMIINLFK